MTWRTGSKVPINVYDGDRPVCQCQTASDAKLIVRAVNQFTPAIDFEVIPANIREAKIWEFYQWVNMSPSMQLESTLRVLSVCLSQRDNLLEDSTETNNRAKRLEYYRSNLNAHLR